MSRLAYWKPGKAWLETQDRQVGWYSVHIRHSESLYRNKERPILTTCHYCDVPAANWTWISKNGRRDRWGIQPPPGVRYLEWDHRNPKSRGGSNRPENIVPACGKCNSKKGDLPYLSFVLGEGPLFPPEVKPTINASHGLGWLTKYLRERERAKV